MTRQAKPWFPSAIVEWSDPAYLPSAKVAELRALLPRKLSTKHKEDFLAYCIAEAESSAQVARIKVPPAELKAGLSAVSAQAARLLEALRALPEGSVLRLQAEWVALSVVTHPPVVLAIRGTRPTMDDGGYVGRAWDTVQDLAEVCDFAASKVTPSRQRQVSLDRARALIRTLAGRYEHMTGAAPPYSRLTWFPDFVRVMFDGAPVSLPNGQALVESVIRKPQ